MSVGVVLDASTRLSWAFDDEAGRYSDAVLDFVSEHHALVPSLWKYEIANGILVGLRRARLSIDEAVSFSADLGAMDIQVDASVLEPLTLLAEAFDTGLTAYDAAYLMLARETGLPLATQDRALMRAARKSGVDIF